MLVQPAQNLRSPSASEKLDALVAASQPFLPSCPSVREGAVWFMLCCVGVGTRLAVATGHFQSA